MTADSASTTYITGRIVRTDLDADDPNASAEAMIVENGLITAIGSKADVDKPAGAQVVDVADGWVLPGLIEPHGHPSLAAFQLCYAVVDIRPVTLFTADDVWAAIKKQIAAKSDPKADDRWVFANGWDPLLQKGLTSPTIDELDRVCPDIPLLIVHNSGHSLYFNSAAAAFAKITKDTPDPAGASFGRDAKGELTGVAFEAGAVELIAMPFLATLQPKMPQIMGDYLNGLRKVGITTVGDLSWQQNLNPLITGLQQAADGTLPVRLRTYEMSRPGATATVPLSNGDDWFRQVGVKIWCDGSPWIGNIATSFPYLTNEATKAIGLEPGHIGKANYTTQQLIDIGSQYAVDGWQLACHSHGDVAVDSTLDAFAAIIDKFALADHRFRIEHCGLMTPEQFNRAHSLGVTTSLFVDHITYWGDVIVDDLFGADHGGGWADAGAASDAGIAVTFHNDGTVTPCEPLRNMAVAQTRTSRTGRHLDGGKAVTRDIALRAHTSNAAWQLHSENQVGILKPGNHADLTVIDRDPRTAAPEDLATATVLATAHDGVLSAV
ncbi:amidohydrolase [Gordonia sp. X0973]|uniref:amidohydrolase n=1 Tax=Gordonia sp. X0973 TaxID=2742602 RepID=UPI000F549EA1|nr:amidohydrolase [Gordonia sp. X0973]QKT07684.1 amidohydrolase [Gordonia sp. X0973]